MLKEPYICQMSHTKMSKRAMKYDRQIAEYVQIQKIPKIGCLKLQGPFRKRATNCWALLRKMTCKDTWMHSMGFGRAQKIGSLKLQVFFRERATNYRAFLRKKTFERCMKAFYESLLRVKIGCLKLQVSFRKRATNYRALVIGNWRLVKTLTL